MASTEDWAVTPAASKWGEGEIGGSLPWPRSNLSARGTALRAAWRFPGGAFWASLRGAYLAESCGPQISGRPVVDRVFESMNTYHVRFHATRDLMTSTHFSACAAASFTSRPNERALYHTYGVARLLLLLGCRKSGTNKRLVVMCVLVD